MSDYLYFQYEELALDRRFDIEASPLDEGYPVNGLKEWRELILLLIRFLTEGDDYIRPTVLSNLREIDPDSNADTPITRSTEELILILLLTRLRRKYAHLPRHICPRLFISHRQSDWRYALRMAQLAKKHKFAYWVDVLDPALSLLNTSTHIPAHLMPLLTACIIEMALINCTHVMACMTPNTRGSLWLPYEYGRITEIPGLSRKAAAWIHPALATADLPEYMYLGELTKTEAEIEAWLKSEHKIHGGLHCKQAADDPLISDYEGNLPDSAEDTSTSTADDEFATWLAQGMPIKQAIKGLPPIKIKPRTF